MSSDKPTMIAKAPSAPIIPVAVGIAARRAPRPAPDHGKVTDSRLPRESSPSNSNTRIAEQNHFTTTSEQQYQRRPQIDHATPQRLKDRRSPHTDTTEPCASRMIESKTFRTSNAHRPQQKPSDKSIQTNTTGQLWTTRRSHLQNSKQLKQPRPIQDRTPQQTNTPDPHTRQVRTPTE